MRYATVLYLEFAFWPTWQMREQTWHNCQAADGPAKARSRASPGPPCDLDFSSRHICSINRDRNPRPSTRRRPQPIEVARDSIASTGPPRAAVRCRSRLTPLRRNSLLTRRRYNWRRGYLGAWRSRPCGKEPTARHTEKIRIRVTFGKCKVNYAKPLEITYF